MNEKEYIQKLQSGLNIIAVNFLVTKVDLSNKDLYANDFTFEYNNISEFLKSFKDEDKFKDVKIIYTFIILNYCRDNK